MPQNQQESELREYIIETFALDMNSEVERAVVEQTVQLFTRLIAERERAVRIDERQFTWDLINNIRYQKTTLEVAKHLTLDRLTNLQVAQLTAAEEETKE